MFLININNIDELCIKTPYVYSISNDNNSKHYVFPIEQSKTKENSYYIIENAMIVSNKNNKLRLCFKETSSDIKIMNLIQNKVFDLIKNSKYKSNLNSNMKVFSPIMNDSINIEFNKPDCYDDFDNKYCMDDFYPHDMVTCVVEIKNFWIGVNWYGLKLVLQQLKIHKNVQRVLNNKSQTSIIPIPPPPPPFLLRPFNPIVSLNKKNVSKQEAENNIRPILIKPSLFDIINAKKHLKQLKKN
jgi:hypothetical protein